MTARSDFQQSNTRSNQNLRRKAYWPYQCNCVLLQLTAIHSCRSFLCPESKHRQLDDHAEHFDRDHLFSSWALARILALAALIADLAAISLQAMACLVEVCSSIWP